MFNLTPTVRNLLIANVVMYIASQFLDFQSLAYYNPILPDDSNGGWFTNPNFRLWQPFTYMFLHGSIGHIFSNMFGLVMFGSAIESYMGSRRFLSYYLLTGIGAAFFYSGLNYYEASQYFYGSDPFNQLMNIPMVGASGAIFGLLVAFGMLFPNVELMMLFFPIPIKAKYFVILYGLYELYAGISGAQSGIAHFAHVGGLIVGYILLRFFHYDERNYGKNR